MASVHGECDPNLLRLLLADALIEEDKAEVIEHLDTCDACQRTLESLAAGSLYWKNARRPANIPGDDPPTHTYPVPSPSGLSGSGSDGHPAEEAGTLDFLAPASDPGHLGVLGPYQVIGVIGRGGMGVVLKALDPALGRTVAIKVLAPQLATSSQARRRFAREGRAAAAIAHEHVVTIHAVAVDPASGLPYLVMTYVPGLSLQDRIDIDGPLPPEQLLRIGMQAASGLAAAHAQGLVHRDVKPANILLQDGVERIKLTDFGLARAVDDASLTQSGVVAGTPLYMSPEQARAEPMDPRSDLYSLGSVLYAMCTGKPPFRAPTTMGVLRRIAEDTPRPVRELNPSAPPWLEALVAWLLAKDPADRPRSAAEVAELLGGCLAHVQSPVHVPLPAELVRRCSVQRVARTSRRSPVIAVLALLGLAGGLGMVGADRVANLVAFVLRIPTPDGWLAIEVYDPETTVFLDGEEVVITGAGVQEFRLRPGPHHLLAKKGERVVSRELFTITRGGRQTVRVGMEPAGAPALSPTAGLMVAPSADAIPDRNFAWRPGTVDPAGPNPALKAVLGGHFPQAWFAEFSPDGKVLATGCEPRAARLWDVATASEIAALKAHRKGDSAAVFSPDGRTLFTSGWDTTVRIWDVTTTAELAVLRGHTDGVGSLALSSDGRTLASASEDATVRLWDVERRCEIRALPEQSATVNCVRFSPDGKTLATAAGEWTDRGRRGEVKLWDVESGQEIASLGGHDWASWAVAFSPDGRTLASTGHEGTVKLWDLDNRQELKVFDAKVSVRPVAFSPDGKIVVTGTYGGRVAAWDVASGRQLVRPHCHADLILSTTFSPDGRTLATTSKDDTVKLWDVAALFGSRN
jgi:serine/threonine protein kinase